MPKPINRRNFLGKLGGGAAALSLSSRSFARQASSPITTTKLTDSVALFRGAGGNVVVIGGPDGLLMINGGFASRSADLMSAISAHFNGQRVQAVFNTDWHLENTGSNDMLGKAGARIIAHENTRLWMSAEFYVQWERKAYPRRAKEAMPTQTFYTNGKMTFGKEELQYGYMLHAHTDGDVYIFLPGPNILVTGDVLTVGSYPVMDWSTGGWIGGLNEGSRALLAQTDAQTRVIPGSGPVQTRADVQLQADMTATVRQRFLDMTRKGMTPREMHAAQPTKEFDTRWGDPTLFIANMYPGITNHVREIGGVV